MVIDRSDECLPSPTSKASCEMVCHWEATGSALGDSLLKTTQAMLLNNQQEN